MNSNPLWNQEIAALACALVLTHTSVAAGTGLTANENWRITHFGYPVNLGPAGDLADPDQDGLANVVEFALGLDPRVSDAGMAPQWMDSAGSLECTIVQPALVGGISYGAEWSDTLLAGSWQPIEDTGEPGVHKFALAKSPGASKFARLKIASIGDEPDSPVPSGTFQMGDQSVPPLGNADGRELPVHTVVIAGFVMSGHEITHEEWEEVRAWGQTRGYTDLPSGNNGYPSKGEYHPVHSITWHDAVKWCNAKSEKNALAPCYSASGAVYRTGVSIPACDWSAGGYRLPTEAEWEMSARGGLMGKNFPWGTDSITHAQANYTVYSKDGVQNFYSYDLTIRPVGEKLYSHPDYDYYNIPFSAPVGSFPPNPYGLHDMAGNVLEWCWDWYGPYDAATQNNPTGPSTGTHRVCRGGGWDKYAIHCRVSDRFFWAPGLRDAGIGFRTARKAPN